jgi:N-acyl-D-amino-acid deacylase
MFFLLFGVVLVYNLLVKNGRVYDGTGNPWFKADIAVSNNQIRKIGRARSDEAEKTIDASGLIVCPGFIDTHTHSEITLLVNGKAESAVRQGITLQVTGNCGGSAAPITEEYRSLIESSFWFMERYRKELSFNWRSFGEYLDRLEKKGTAINVASLMGHGTIRACVMGDEQRVPRKDEMEAMKSLVADSMIDGAYGISVGLNITPSSNASTQEIIELCKIVAKHRGLYFTHQREYGTRFSQSTLETIEIGEKTGIVLHPVHHRPIIYEFQGDVNEVTEILDEAREKDVNITCDLYSYINSGAGLDGMLPHWVLEGGIEQTLSYLKDPVTRQKVKEDMLNPHLDLNMGFIPRTGIWDKVIILNLNKSKQYIGKNLLEISEIMGVEPIDAVLNIIIEEGVESTNYPTTQPVTTKETILTLFKHPAYMVGSDGVALAPYGILGQKRVHPRCYGCYPRILGRWVRDEKLISMEEAIRKMTSFPAQVLGLQDRGMIKEGVWADIVIFDPKTVIDKATFENPHQYPEGIKYVIVNGHIVIEDQEHTSALPGKVLRGPGYII